MEKKLRETLEGGQFKNVSPIRSKAMSAVRGRGNRTTELQFRLALVRAGISGWKMHVPDIVGKPDFFFPTQRVAVFVDGCFWHGCPECGHIPNINRPYWSEKIRRNKERDIEKTQKLKLIGIRVVRFWEHELQQETQRCIEVLKKVLDEKPTDEYNNKSEELPYQNMNVPKQVK